MDFNVDEWLEAPVKWLETLVDYLPEWPPSWLPDSPPEWVIDLVEKYAPYLPSAYFADFFQLGLPHFYVQQNVCEKAFDIGVLILTFGTLIVIVLLLRRCLATETSRIKERWICCECRAEKSEVLSEDLIHVEKRVELLKNASQNVNKKLQGCLQGQGTDGAALEKRLKKLPQILLSNSMLESSVALGDRSIFGTILRLCGKVQKLLGNEILEYEAEVEKDVINKQLELLEVDIPNIVKQRKHLAKLTLDMDSAKTRYQTASRHSLQASGTNATKAEVIKDEMDDASMKVEQCRDLLVSDMFNLISRESELAQQFVTLVKCQAEYHKKALNILDSYTNCMEEEIRNSHYRPVYGCLLEDHLNTTERLIALPLEFCICFLMEYGINEEGLFRVAGSASKVKKLKTAFDANMFDIIDMSDYLKDLHAVAGALKSYLRELPNPLMTHELYNEWIQAARITDTDTRLQALWSIVQKLPVPYFHNLRYIMKFLNKLSANQDVNKMTAQNLAIVIAPNLIWAPEEGSTALGMNMSLANMYSLIVDNLIVHADWFFPGDVEFFLPSPLLRSPHDTYGFHSSSGHPPDNENQINGELDVHPSLLTTDSNNVHYNQQSPQFGGSPKSLRRNKKPAPPAPSVLREKPPLLEKSAPDRTVTHEKIVVEKNTLERRSSSSDKERHLPFAASSKPNQLDKNQMNNVQVEKPQIPEKPNFEKVMTSSTDLIKPNVFTAPVPLERHHVEKAQIQTSSVDKTQPVNVHLSEEISPVHDESKNTIPELVLPSVESESDDDDVQYVPYRPRSPAEVDRFDYYRPDWYGSEQDDSEKLNPVTEVKKPDVSSPEIFLFKKKISAEESEFQELDAPKESSPEIFHFEKKVTIDKPELQEFKAPKEFSPEIFHFEKKVTADKHELREFKAPKAFSPEISNFEKKVTSDESELQEPPQASSLEMLHFKKKVTPEKSQELHVETETPDKIGNRIVENKLYNVSYSNAKTPPPSEEFIVIGIPPHSIQFIRPQTSSENNLAVEEEKESTPKIPSISPDILGNLPFLSRKSPTLSNDARDQLPTKPDNEDTDSLQSSSKAVTPKLEVLPSFSQKKEISSSSKEELVEKENIPENLIESDTMSFEQKQSQKSNERINVSRENLPHYSGTIPRLSSRSESEMEYELGDHSRSYTDSDRWSHSERSLSPECISSEMSLPPRQMSLPIFGEYSDPVEEPMFEMSRYWHPTSSRKDHPVYQRPISPESTQSVPYTSATKQTEDDYKSSSSSLPRKMKPVDSWFSNNEEPVAKPRRSSRSSPVSSSRPKRPALPQNLPDSKPKRPERPPLFRTVETTDSQGSCSFHVPHSQEQGSYNPLESRFPLLLSGEKLEDSQKTRTEQLVEGSLQTRIRGSPAAPKRPPRPQPPPPPPPFKPRQNSASEDTHL